MTQLESVMTYNCVKKCKLHFVHGNVLYECVNTNLLTNIPASLRYILEQRNTCQ